MSERVASVCMWSVMLALAGGPAQASINDVLDAYDVLASIPAPQVSLDPRPALPAYQRPSPTRGWLAHGRDIPYLREIGRVARRHGLDPRDLLALIRAESAFDRMAVSRAGARGLMQLMPVHAYSNGIPVSELFDPQKNLEIGASYFAELLERHADKGARQYDYALASWNFGPSAVDAGYRWPLETREFIRRFKRFKRDYQDTFAREDDL